MNDTTGHPDKSPRRSWLPALMLWLAGSAALMAFAYVRFAPNYIARSQIEVVTKRPTVFGPEPRRIELSQFLQSQAATIASPTIAGKTLADHPDLAAMPMLKKSDDREGNLVSALRIGIVPRTNFIQVEVMSTIPTEAARLVNAVVGSYLDYAHQHNDTSTQKRIEPLKTTRDEQRAEVVKLRATVLSMLDRPDSQTDGKALDSLKAACRDHLLAEAKLDRIEEAVEQYQFAARNPGVSVELSFPASMPLRPDSFRRWQLMAASPLAVGLLVFGPLLVFRRGARRNDLRSD